MATKKITDVDMITSLKDSNTLFINEEGTVKQIPLNESNITRIDLLWENASPTSSMPDQTIALSEFINDYNNYNLLLYLFRYSIADGRNISAIGRPGYSVIGSFSFGSSGKVFVAYRTAGVTSNGLRINAAFNATPSTDAVNNEFMILTHVYGIK